MAKINIIHDTIGKTLTVHLDDPKKEYICEMTDDEIILMKDINGKIIGFEIIHLGENPDDDISVQRIS